MYNENNINNERKWNDNNIINEIIIIIMNRNIMIIKY